MIMPMNLRKTIRADRATIEAAYLVFLGRLPESEQVIDFYEQRPPIELLDSIAKSPEYQQRNGRNVLYHYNSPLNCEAIILHHARRDIVAVPGLCTNFLGVRIDPKFLPSVLSSMVGQIDRVPIPGNWHADTAEWAAALRAVDLAENTFHMLELGCGWGCWMVNTGVAAKAAGLKVHVAGVEADAGHIEFAREACLLNEFTEDEFELRRGIVSADAGTALFPRQEQAGEHWGNEPILNATPAKLAELNATGRYDQLPTIGLSELTDNSGRLDLLHIDIQGGEADFIRSCREELSALVAYLVVGTHSREIEGQLFETLLTAGWQLEIERPAILNVDKEPYPKIDGLQGWRNRRLIA